MHRRLRGHAPHRLSRFGQDTRLFEQGLVLRRPFHSAQRAEDLSQSVADGYLTQEQADWLASRGNETPALINDDGTCEGDCLADETYLSTMTKSRQRGAFGK